MAEIEYQGYARIEMKLCSNLSNFSQFQENMDIIRYLKFHIEKLSQGVK